MLSNLSRPARTLLSARPATRLFSANAMRMADKDTSALDAKKGSVGSKFQPDGEIGQVGEKVGGPFASDGKIGKQFTEQGAVGDKAQKAAEQAQGEKPAMFDKEGVVGRQFKADGSIGSIGEAVGGPFAKDGAIGKHFNPDGKVGGAVQEELGEKGNMKK